MAELALERYNPAGRDLVMYNQQPKIDYDMTNNQRPYSDYDMSCPYHRNGPHSAAPPIHAQLAGERKLKHFDFKEHENRSAIINYNNFDKAHLREGKNAVAVTQLHQNDLHNITVTPSLQESHLDDTSGDRTQNYIKQHLKLQSKFAYAQNGGHPKESNFKAINGSQNSDLRTSFDPLKDRHLWTMWRTAVNGRIVDEVRQLERKKYELGPVTTAEFEQVDPGMYGKALVAPPLKRFIRFDKESKEIANKMSSYGQGNLETLQFVYYGLPRVYVTPRK